MLFKKRKLPVLTDSTCNTINLINKIAEVLTGSEAQIKRFDFNTGRGQLWVGGEVLNFYFEPVDGYDGNRFHFATLSTDSPSPIREDYGWNMVHLEEDGQVRIGAVYERNAHNRSDGMPLWWVGDSSSNRREEPYWP